MMCETTTTFYLYVYGHFLSGLACCVICCCIDCSLSYEVNRTFHFSESSSCLKRSLLKQYRRVVLVYAWIRHLKKTQRILLRTAAPHRHLKKTKNTSAYSADRRTESVRILEARCLVFASSPFLLQLEMPLQGSACRVFAVGYSYGLLVEGVGVERVENSRIRVCVGPKLLLYDTAAVPG